jgi:ribosomal protein L12E/L44/L45/RPP1/RPP2
MTTNRSEQAFAYTTLLPAGASITTTADKLQGHLKSASIESIYPIWFTIFARTLESKEINKVHRDCNHLACCQWYNNLKAE